MNDILPTLILLLVPGIPLLLAFPALRSRLSRPYLFALLPTIILVIISSSIPVNFSINIPWLVLGSGLGIDTLSRLFLTMSVILWIIVSLYLYRSTSHVVSRRFTTYFLITMAGNLGVILSTELVVFFTFLTLMSYGFYGLLVDNGGKSIQKAGRIYLSFVILADLMLFEALLIAATTTDNLSFELIRQEISASSSLNLYMSVVLFGFAAKAGMWPLHFWLSSAFRLSRPEIVLLIVGVPIAMGLFGMLRWLPLGEIHSPDLGMSIKTIGVAAMLYSFLFSMLQAKLKTLPTHIVVFFTGLYAVVLGAGMADPVVWRQYEYLTYVIIILMLISLSVLVAIITWLATNHHYALDHERQTKTLPRHLEHLNETVINYFTEIRTGTLLRMRTVWLTKTCHLHQAFVLNNLLWQKKWDNSERFLQRWTIAVTLFLLIGMIVVFLVA